VMCISVTSLSVGRGSKEVCARFRNCQSPAVFSRNFADWDFPLGGDKIC
jgi:hypothetical protein